MDGDRTHTQAPLRVVLVGHVDHGKSTLTGRLLADSGSLPDGKIEAVRKSCERRGVPFEWAFLLDALQAERDQNVTIDTSHVWLRPTAGHGLARETVLIDAPGHREFLKNMITGAAQADAAVLLVAADEGVKDQTRRHAQLLSLLGISQVIVVVNKLDRIDRAGDRFWALEADVRALLTAHGISPRVVIPVIARDGENVVTPSETLGFYRGPTVLHAIAGTPPRVASAEAQPLRVVVQDVYRFDERRIVAGRVEAGVLQVGDRLRFSPGAREGTVKTIESWGRPSAGVARAGDVVGFTLAEQIFVERGQLAVAAQGSGLSVTRRLRARVFWMGRQPLTRDRPLKIRLCTREEQVRVVGIERVVDAGSLNGASSDSQVRANEVADVVLEARAPLAFDRADSVLATGRFVLVDGRDVAGGGLVLQPLDEETELATSREVDDGERARRFGHRGAVVSVGDGLRAIELERALFEQGFIVARASDVVAARALSRAGLVVIGPIELEDALHLSGTAELIDDVEAVTAAVRLSAGAAP